MGSFGVVIEVGSWRAGIEVVGEWLVMWGCMGMLVVEGVGGSKDGVV